MSRRFFPLAAAAAALLLSASCQVRQDVTLQIGGAGSSRILVELHPVFTRYYSDLASGFLPSFDPRNPVYFDAPGIGKNLSANPDLEVLWIRTPAPHKLDMEIRFRDIGRAIRGGDPEIRDIMSLRREGKRETLAIHLDRSNLSSILRVLSPDKASPLKALLPPAGRPLSETEYLEHLSWALEDYAGPGEIADVLRSSAVTLRVRVPGKIAALDGGVPSGDSEALFVVPVLRLLTLETPVDLSLTYTP